MSGGTTAIQQDESSDEAEFEIVRDYLRGVLKSSRRPSAGELSREAFANLGPEPAWALPAVLTWMSEHAQLNGADRDYCRSLAQTGDLIRALRGAASEPPDISSSIDLLLNRGRQYRSTKAFAEMVGFMAKFRDYAPYNVMLVRLQNPSCGFFATDRDWLARFGRRVKEDARPMLILAPMHPVMLVYALDDTEGPDLPDEINNFARFLGEPDPSWLENAVVNATRHRIIVDRRELSLTHAGFATTRATGDAKMRVVLNTTLDVPSQLGVLCHELAHIFLGHLGSDHDRWWPARANINSRSMEFEAEAVAFIVTERLGLNGSSSEYVSRHLEDGQIPGGVSLDLIAKVAGSLERMFRQKLPAPKPRPVS